jgi:small subunit ribosomal protein S21
MAIVVKSSGNEPIEVLIRKFNKKVQNDGVLTKLKEREFYEKPSQVRQRRKKAAKRRLFLAKRSF